MISCAKQMNQFASSKWLALLPKNHIHNCWKLPTSTSVWNLELKPFGIHWWPFGIFVCLIDIILEFCQGKHLWPLSIKAISTISIGIGSIIHFLWSSGCLALKDICLSNLQNVYCQCHNVYHKSFIHLKKILCWISLSSSTIPSLCLIFLRAKNGTDN